MKKIISLILSCLLILGLCACQDSEDGGAKYEGLQVGFSRKSITPTQQGVQIAGGDASSRLSIGFMDEVASTCIAIQKGEDLFLIYTMDFMVLNQASVDAVKPLISQTTGVPLDRILLNCTHTHSGVNILSDGWDGGTAYRQLVAKRSAEAATEAIADLSPASIEIASCDTEGLAFVRHYIMNDGTTCGNGHGSSASGYKSHMYAS